MYDDALALSAYCSGDLKVVETLKQQTSMASSQHLEPYEALLLGYIESLTLLQSRICNILDLVCVEMGAPRPRIHLAGLTEKYGG